MGKGRICLKTVLIGAAIFVLVPFGTMAKQAARGDQQRNTANALYESLDATPGWPTKATPDQVDRALAERGVKPEDRAAIIALMKGNICENPDMVPVCRYFGADTIYKLQKLSWANLGVGGKDLQSTQMRLLEYGFSENLRRTYGDKGLTDQQDAELDNSAGNSNLKRRLSALSAWLACSADIKTLTQTGWIWRDYKLTTCGVGLGFRIQIGLFGFSFSVEADVLLTNSRFARKVLFVWWPAGSEPNICAQAQLNTSGAMHCNSNYWISPIAANAGVFFNQPLTHVVSHGSGARLGTPFSVTIVHQ